MDLKKVVEFQVVYWPNSCKYYHYKLKEDTNYSIYYLSNWIRKFCKSNNVEFVGANTTNSEIDSFYLLFKDKNGLIYLCLKAVLIMDNVITGVLNSLRRS